MRRLIIGDVHGNYDKLMVALERANYNEEDILYSVGDMCDRGQQNLDVVRWFIEHNVKMVVGNHDVWLQNYLYTGTPERMWSFNGGNPTYHEFEEINDRERKKVFNYIHNCPYLIEEKDFIIVHGGIPRPYEKDWEKLKKERPNVDNMILFEYGTPIWDRTYFNSAVADTIGKEYDRIPIETRKTIFCGHSPLIGMDKKYGIRNGKPYINNNFHLINIDTGAAHNGPITIMDIDTRDYWQSDFKEITDEE